MKAAVLDQIGDTELDLRGDVTATGAVRTSAPSRGSAPALPHGADVVRQVVVRQVVARQIVVR